MADLVDQQFLVDERFQRYAARAGDVVLEAKTTALAKHYERDFGAVRLPTFQSSAPRYLIAEEAAKRIFFTYLV